VTDGSDGEIINGGCESQGPGAREYLYQGAKRNRQSRESFHPRYHYIDIKVLESVSHVSGAPELWSGRGRNYLLNHVSPLFGTFHDRVNGVG
jgi:hypothetical protein